MAGRLAGKVAFLTAAARGIGFATARAFAAEGAAVVATDVDDDAIAQAPRTAGVRFQQLDAADGAAVTEMIKRLGRVDILFNGVGWTHHGDALHCTEQAWALSFGLNVTTMFHAIRAVLPGMVARGGGSIVNMGSVQSSIASTPNRFAYGMTKGAVIGLTKSVARDFAAHGIRCNVICPGAIDTPAMRGRMADQPDAAADHQARIAAHPLGRLGRTEEVAAVAVMLASDEAEFLTGAALVIDGGYTL